MYLVFFSMIALLLPSPCFGENDVRLVGVWKVKSASQQDSGGIFDDSTKAMIAEGAFFEFSKDAVTFRTTKKTTVLGSYKTFMEDNQNKIDIQCKKEVEKGIYKFQNDMLFLCFATNANGARPSEYKTRQHNQNQVVWILEKVK